MSNTQMAMASTNTLSFALQLYVDTNMNKVLFAKAGKDVVDFLFNILSMPVGTVIRLLQTLGMVGSLGNIHKSVEELNDMYIASNERKSILLNPKLAISAANSVPLSFPDSKNVLYICSCSYCSSHLSDDPGVHCPQCKRLWSVVGGGYVKDIVTYVIMDDLMVKPISTFSNFTDFVDEYNVKEDGALQQKEIKLSAEEAMKMLKASFMTKTVLTDVFLGEETKREVGRVTGQIKRKRGSVTKDSSSKSFFKGHSK